MLHPPSRKSGQLKSTFVGPKNRSPTSKSEAVARLLHHRRGGHLGVGEGTVQLSFENIIIMINLNRRLAQFQNEHRMFNETQPPTLRRYAASFLLPSRKTCHSPKPDTASICA